MYPSVFNGLSVQISSAYFSSAIRVSDLRPVLTRRKVVVHSQAHFSGFILSFTEFQQG